MISSCYLFGSLAWACAF